MTDLLQQLLEHQKTVGEADRTTRWENPTTKEVTTIRLYHAGRGWPAYTKISFYEVGSIRPRTTLIARKRAWVRQEGEDQWIERDWGSRAVQ